MRLPDGEVRRQGGSAVPFAHGLLRQSIYNFNASVLPQAAWHPQDSHAAASGNGGLQPDPKDLHKGGCKLALSSSHRLLAVRRIRAFGHHLALRGVKQTRISCWNFQRGELGTGSEPIRRAAVSSCPVKCWRDAHAPAGLPLLAAPKHLIVLDCVNMQEGFAPATAVAPPTHRLRGG